MPQNTTLQSTFDRATQPLKALSWRIDPTTIRPETLSGACTAVGQMLCFLGLASNETDGQQLDNQEMSLG